MVKMKLLTSLISLRFASHLACFDSLPISSVATDYNLFQRILNDYKSSLDLKEAMQTHAQIVKLGFGMDPSVISRLVLAYSSCGNHNLARLLLDESSCWNVDLVTGNMMISSFMKNKDVDLAKKVFLNMPFKDVISWNSLIGGYVKNSRFEEALRLFKDMFLLGVEPDAHTYSSIVAGCARLGALHHALWIHETMIQKGIVLNDILVSALIDMYAKCGKIDKAVEIFKGRSSSDVSVWNAMITGLAIHGRASDAISVFSQMDEHKVSPDRITFVGVLSACSHCGLVELGRSYFELMTKQFSINPELEHYGAMVDLLGRAGRLDDAYSIIRAMPIDPDVVIWKSLLSACRTHKNSALAELAATKISSFDGGDYVQLSNTYCSLYKWGSSADIREIMKINRVHKGRGKSWIELAGVIHHFKAGDQGHPEIDKIQKFLKQLIGRAKLEGYVPATELVLMDVSEEEKEENLNFHSERLALAFGVLKTSPRTELRISKNLRTCSDCHSFFKLASRMLARVIIVRDRIRFHKFEGGTCSCGDYW